MRYLGSVAASEDDGGRMTPIRASALEEEFEHGGGVKERMVDNSGWRGW